MEDFTYWIKLATTEFYELVYKDTWFKKIFRNIDQEIITSQQIDFMVGAFGGPKKFNGRLPKDAHPHIWINEEIWNYRESLLVKAFENTKTPNEIREKWLKIDNAFKGSIINKGSIDECVGRYKTDEIIFEPIPEFLKKRAS